MDDDFAGVDSVSDFFVELYAAYINDDSQQWVPDAETQAVYPDPIDHPSVVIYPDGNMFGDYDELHSFLQATDLTGGSRSDEHVVEAHELLTYHFMEPFGIGSELPAVALDWRDGDRDATNHAYLTAEIARTLDNVQFYDIHDVYNAHADLYREINHSEWIDRVDHFMREHVNDFTTAYENGAVPGAHHTDWDDRLSYVLDWLNQFRGPY